MADPLGYRSLLRILRCVVVLLLGFPGCWRWPAVGEAVAMATCRYSEEQKEVSSSRTSGNASLIGLFNLQSNRRDCDPSSRPVDQVRPVNAAETQRMLAAIWALEWLNERDVLGGGMTVGFTGYSACTDTKTALRKAIYGLSQMGRLDRCHDNETANMLLGFIGPTDYSNSEAISGLLTSLNVTHQQSRLNTLESEIKAITSVLNRLEWDQITLMSENAGLRDQFFEISAREGICISQSFIIDRDANYTSIYPCIKQSGSQVIVFLGFDYQLLKALEESSRFPDLSDLHWLVAGPTVYPGFKLNRVSQNPDKHHKIYFAQSAVTKVPGFEDYLLNFPESVELDADVRAFVNDCFKDKSKQLESASTASEEISPGCAPILNNDVIAVAESVAKLTERYRSSRNGCPSTVDDGSATANSDKNETAGCETFGDYLFQVPQLLSDQLNVSVMAYQVGPQNNMRFIEVGLYFNNQLIMKAEDLGILHDVGGGWFKVPRFRCPSCPCLNNPDKTHSALGDFWRVEPWVAVCGTLASIGTLVAIMVLVFIVVRICRGDAMEGSQAFAFLILVGIVLAYGAIVPFMLSASPIVCNIRPIGIGLAYALIFAPILARSLMLATSDPDGLLGHVSGLVQTSLFFFMIAVQLALGVQQWWLVSGPEANPLSIRYDGVGCIVSTVDYTMALSYVSLLLVLLLILTPFCIRNRRNYHEGLFFFLATLASLAVWVAWVAVFFKLDPFWKQPILCLGLVSTASVILVIVFIPRVFKMVRAITLDTANAGGQSVGRCTVPSVTDVAARGSNAMIYETVNHAYAPEPILVNGDGVVVKSPSRINVSANPAASVGIVVEDSGIIVPMASAETIEEEEPEETKEITGPTIAEEMEKVKAIDDSSPEKEENGSTNGVAQRKPPTVTHL